MKTFLPSKPLSRLVLVASLTLVTRLPAATNYEPYTVRTLAGSSASGSADGTGTAARFNAPFGIAVDGTGTIYVADTQNSTIRKVTQGDVVTTFAGSAGVTGSTDGQGAAARFNNPTGIATDSVGNVYVSDSGNYVIRKIAPDATVSTLAGSPGQSGSIDGKGSAARFSVFLGHLAVDGSGNIIVADYANQTIRKVAPDGTVTTIAGAAGAQGGADGAALQARFKYPRGIAIDSNGTIYISDEQNNTIRKLANGTVSTLAGPPGGDVSGGSNDGTGAAAQFQFPEGLAVDRAGNVYVADSNGPLIRKVTPAGVVTTLAGVPGTSSTQDGTGNNALFTTPEGIAVDGAGTIYMTDCFGNNAIRVGTPPVSIVNGTSVTARTGQAFRFPVLTVNGSPTESISATGLPPGLTIDPVTGVISGTPTSDGTFNVRFTVTVGAATTTATLGITCVSDPGLPVIVSASVVTVPHGSPFTYQIVAPAQTTASDVTTFSITGQLPAGLTFDAARGIISGTVATRHAIRTGGVDSRALSGGTLLGTIQMFANNSHGQTTSPLVFLQLPAMAVNISTRLAVGTDENVLIGGFIVTGNALKIVLVRGLGPSLGANGVQGVMQDPVLELRDQAGKTIASNDDWRSDQEAEIKASTIPPPDDRESAIVALLQPSSYTAILHGKSAATGIGLVEAYDLGTASCDIGSAAQFANLSTRGFVRTGNDVMIGGLIAANGSATFMLRAIGPSLTAAGIGNALSDPVLELHNADGSTVVTNDNWKVRSDGSSQEAQIRATTIAPTNDLESAVVQTLAPGSYTAIVRGNNDASGVGLVEIYNLQ